MWQHPILMMRYSLVVHLENILLTLSAVDTFEEFSYVYTLLLFGTSADKTYNSLKIDSSRAYSKIFFLGLNDETAYSSTISKIAGVNVCKNSNIKS